MNSGERIGYVVSRSALPSQFPTHRHESVFWEALGRAVATFGFLEDVLCKAIFAFTATTHYDDDKIETAYAAWLPTLERALVDPLGNLIDVYGKAVRYNSEATIQNLDALLSDLRDASKLRNVICHGFWGVPSSNGATIPSFVNRQHEVFDTPIDVPFLEKLQRGTAELACAVVDTVTHMGWQFPGSTSPGQAIWAPRSDVQYV